MIRNIITLFIAAIFILFFSSPCICQDNNGTSAGANSNVTDSANKDKGEVKGAEKKVKAEEAKKEKEAKIEEETTKTGEEKAKENKEKTEKESLQIEDQTLDNWSDSAPTGRDFQRDEKTNDIWSNDQGFLDR